MNRGDEGSGSGVLVAPNGFCPLVPLKKDEITIMAAQSRAAPVSVENAAGVAAACENSRVVLAYSESCITRGDLLMIGTFLFAWLVLAGLMEDFSGPESTANAGRLGGLVQGVTLLWAPIFGIILDRFDPAPPWWRWRWR